MFSSLQERESYFLKNPETRIGPGAYMSDDSKSTKEIDPKSLYNTKDRLRSQKNKRMMKLAKDSVFKSNSKRLPEEYKFTPGPGSYKPVSSMPHAYVIKEERDSPFYQIIESGARLTKMQPYASNKVDRFNYINMPHVGFTKREYGKRENIDEKALEMKHKKKIDKRSVPVKRTREVSWETVPSIPSGYNQKIRSAGDDEQDLVDGTTSGSTVLKTKPKKDEDKQPAEVSPCTYQPDFNKLK